MKRLSFVLLAVVLMAASVFLPAPSAQALSATDPVWGLTASDELVRFTAGTPGTVAATVTISGLSAGDTLVGMDFRPLNGTLYAVSNNSRIYAINTTSGVATLTSTLSVALAGTKFGVDFNPAVDRLRIVSDTDQNLRVNVDTGVVAVDVSSTGDTALQYGATDVNVAANPQVVASGYTNPVAGTPSTALQGIDAGTNALVTQAPPNAGTLATVGALGVDAGVDTSFDITSDGSLRAAITLEGGTSTGWYSLATTGAATLVGTIGGGEIIKGLAIPLPTQAPVWGLTLDNKIVTMAGVGAGRVASTVSVTGLAASGPSRNWHGWSVWLGLDGLSQ